MFVQISPSDIGHNFPTWSQDNNLVKLLTEVLSPVKYIGRVNNIFFLEKMMSLIIRNRHA